MTAHSVKTRFGVLDGAFIRAVQSTALNPFTMLSMLWAQRRLAGKLIQREVSSRYKGAFLGIAWSFITPLFMLSVYTFFVIVQWMGRTFHVARASRP